MAVRKTVKKIYIKQTEDSTPGDWYLLLKKYFEFIGVDMNEEEIKNTPKDE